MENLLVPRNLEGRKDKLKQLNIRLLSQEVIDENLDLNLDESFMDIDPKFVKFKKTNCDVILSGNKWTEIPEWLKNVEINGSFYCIHNKLVTLKNCPHKIRRSFYCYDNELISLEGSPEIIGSTFNCSSNKLISLKGCPKEIGGHFNCSHNQLTDIEYFPENIGGHFACYDNKVKLELLVDIKIESKFINSLFTKC